LSLPRDTIVRPFRSKFLHSTDNCRFLTTKVVRNDKV